MVTLRATLKWSFYFSFCPLSAITSNQKNFSKDRIGLAPLYWPQVGRRTGAMSGEVFYGRSVRWLEGSRTAKGIVGRRTADGWKLLLLLRTALSINLLRFRLIQITIFLKPFHFKNFILNFKIFESTVDEIESKFLHYFWCS